MTLDQDHFFWGCGEPVQFGLYSPVVDRFVCVGNTYELFEYVTFLMSAKIRLLIVPLHYAPNFELNLIDNTCCTQWGVTNWPANSLDLKFDVPKRQQHFVVDTCGELAELPNKMLVDIQNFIFLSCRVIQLFKFSKNYQYRIFSNLIKLPFDNYAEIKDIEQQCYQTVYLSDDYHVAKIEVDRLCQTAEQIL